MYVTNAQWERIAPHFKQPPRKDNRGGIRKDPRAVLQGIFWIVKTRAQWKELPDRYSPYQTCHRWFQRWRDEGLIETVLTELAQHLEEVGGHHTGGMLHRRLILER